MEPNQPIEQKQPKPPIKWKVIAISLIVVSTLLAALSTFLIVDKISNKTNDKNDTSNQDQSNQEDENNDEEDETDNVFIISEWNLKFIIPDSLTDIRYVIDGETAYLVGRPSDGSLQYPSNLNGRIKDETLAVLYRSTSSTQMNLDISIPGKKVGNYYFYTAWSFSGLASGAGVPSIFDVDDTVYSDALNDVFHNMNDMLNSIQAIN